VASSPRLNLSRTNARQDILNVNQSITSALDGNLTAKSSVDVSDLLLKRIPGARIKHHVKQNWLKMYNKAGSVIWLETVINEPEGFKVRKQVTRDRKHVMEWIQMRKGEA
jgi:hypothetical protein